MISPAGEYIPHPDIGDVADGCTDGPDVTEALIAYEACLSVTRSTTAAAVLAAAVIVAEAMREGRS